jgi:hypothetical protein
MFFLKLGLISLTAATPFHFFHAFFFLAGDDFGNQVKGNDRELTSSMAYLFSALQVSQKVHLVMKPRPCFDG